jgi:DNA-directed RNA polymerase, mitochondrial
MTEVEMSDPTTILRGIVDKEIPVSKVVASRSVSSDQEAAEMIRVLSKTAVEMNVLSVMDELGQTKALGGDLLPDPLQDVPAVVPVLRVKVEFLLFYLFQGLTWILQERNQVDGSKEPEHEVPFNLETLRKHLGQLILARRVLPEDVFTRQKLLEDSVYEVATERLKRQAEIFEELGIGDNRLKNSHLQRWMWDWHQKLQKRLKSEVADIIKAEEAICESFFLPSSTLANRKYSSS